MFQGDTPRAEFIHLQVERAGLHEDDPRTQDLLDREHELLALHRATWVGGLDESPQGNPAGDVVRIDRHGHRTHLGVVKLFYPSGFAAGPHGAIYVSNCSIAPATGLGMQLCPTGGQVVRIG